MQKEKQENREVVEEVAKKRAEAMANTESKPKHLHIVGICGVATSAIAIALHRKGWMVSGSDKGFYPPVSTALNEAGVPYYAGWHPEKMISPQFGGMPDLLMIGGVGKSSVNPEMLYAKEHNIPTFSFPQILEKYFLKEHVIVCAGTWGKTTTSTLLSFILEQAGLDPTYMFGGLSLSQDQAAKLTDGKWTVLEGDEYTGSQFDNVAKFFHYHPTHLLLTSLSWDHADVYPTEQSYFDAFVKLIAGLAANNLLLACTDDAGTRSLLEKTKTAARMVSYGKNVNAKYRHENVRHTKEGLAFDIHINDDAEKNTPVFHIASPMLGAYNAENITACFAMAYEIGIPTEKITRAIAEFKGIKRRLEKRFEGDVTVLDCHAPTPEKARSVLASIREVFPAPARVIAVFEPNIGGRQRETMHMYEGVFSDADKVIIPRLTVLKKESSSEKNPAQNFSTQKNSVQKTEPLEGAELTDIISKKHRTADYIEDDTQLVKQVAASAKKGDIIAFLGSHGFRGMIEETITSLRQQSQH